MNVNSRCEIYDDAVQHIWYHWTFHVDEIIIQCYHINQPHMFDKKFMVLINNVIISTSSDEDSCARINDLEPHYSYNCKLHD